jgi:RNA polymerase sigma-70 factor (ECF subfamily)
MLTMAHRRAVDRVRASQSSRDRDSKVGIRDFDREYDQVAEHVEITLEGERVKRALQGLTELQRQAVELAYYKGFSHSEIAAELHVPVGTIKTRIRDGMIRLRDALGVTS